MVSVDPPPTGRWGSPSAPRGLRVGGPMERELGERDSERRARQVAEFARERMLTDDCALSQQHTLLASEHRASPVAVEALTWGQSRSSSESCGTPQGWSASVQFSAATSVQFSAAANSSAKQSAQSGNTSVTQSVVEPLHTTGALGLAVDLLGLDPVTGQRPPGLGEAFQRLQDRCSGLPGLGGF
jgi:hypothetical protein